jgi:hypothetical protein
MGDFGDILRRGRLRQKIKAKRGIWGSCDYCEKRKLLFEYKDVKGEKWMLCSSCVNEFIKDEDR